MVTDVQSTHVAQSSGPHKNRPIEREREQEEVHAKMAATATYRGASTRKEKTKRLWMKLMMILAVALASMAVVAVQAQAGSFERRPPKEVLFEGTQALQTGNAKVFEWHFYTDNGSWYTRNPYYNDTFNPWPSADVVSAGSRLRIKIDKPQRPRDVKIEAYQRLREGGEGIPDGTPQVLQHSLGRVVRDGKTVGWNVYFHVNEPSRQYYLSVYARWDRVPGTHISYGWATKYFHVRTS